MKRLLLLSAVVALGTCATARASTGDEQALAKRYAPVVRLVEQKEECGPGEPYQPIDVNALFGQPTVALRGPWNGSDLVKIGPTAQRSHRRALRLPPRLPGRRALPGLRLRDGGPACITEGHEPTVYAHVATEPGAPGPARAAVLVLLRLQRLEQPARGRLGDDPARLRRGNARARRSRSSRPRSATASTRERSRRPGATTSSSSSTAPTRSSTRRPARTRTSTTTALFLGSSAEQGVGCDDTNGPHDDLRPAVATIPSDPAQAGAEFPWIDFQGRWGELQPAFFNGPTGPNLKDAVDRADHVVARAGATRASPSRPAAPSGRRRPTSSAGRSAAGRGRWCSSSTGRCSSP